MALGFEPAALRSALERATQMVVDFYEGLEARRVMPMVQRDALRRELAGTLGETGIGLGKTLDEVERVILPNAMGTPHPTYLGLVNSTPLPGGIAADVVISALNNNGGAYGQSPSMTTTEEEVIRVFADLFELDDRFTGMVLPGGTLATLQALQLARDHAFPSWRESGPLSLDAAPLVYTSAVSHFSVARAAHTIGVGSDGVVAIPTLGRGRIDPTALDAAITRDKQNGGRPFLVVATLGTTGTGALDDIEAIADICEAHQLWLHVDACYGGAAALLDELRPAFASLNRADSVCVDAHKWFFVPITAGLLLTRHPETELASYDVEASYIPGDATVDAFRRGLPTSRRSSGFAVWVALRAYGWAGIRAAVQRNVELSRLIENRLADKGFVILPDGQLSIACARWEPQGWSADAIDTLQLEIAERVRDSGEAWFATVRHEGRTWLRLNMVNVHTNEEHVRAIVECTERAAHEAERAVAAGACG